MNVASIGKKISTIPSSSRSRELQQMPQKLSKWHILTCTCILRSWAIAVFNPANHSTSQHIETEFVQLADSKKWSCHSHPFARSLHGNGAIFKKLTYIFKFTTYCIVRSEEDSVAASLLRLNKGKKQDTSGHQRWAKWSENAFCYLQWVWSVKIRDEARGRQQPKRLRHVRLQTTDRLIDW